MNTDPLLAFLLRERPPAIQETTLSGFWHEARTVRGAFSLPIDQAIAGGFIAGRVGFAFASGYQAALHALAPSLPENAVASLCVTEDAGNHPRSIRSFLTRDADGFVLDGSKRWSTMAPVADVLVVIATTGTDSAGRPLLKAVLVERGAPGLTVKEMPPPPFVPEVAHAELTFARVRISESAVLSGDGYTDYTKAFRTLEDLHVNAAVVGHFLGMAIAHRFPKGIAERLVACVLAARTVAALAPKAAETHVALAGLLAEIATLAADLEPCWQLAGDAAEERWYRDRALVQVAGKARETRRERAWQALDEGSK